MSDTAQLNTDATHTATGTVALDDTVLVPSVGVGFVGWIADDATDPCARHVGIVIPNSDIKEYVVPYYVAVAWKR